MVEQSFMNPRVSGLILVPLSTQVSLKLVAALACNDGWVSNDCFLHGQ